MGIQALDHRAWECGLLPQAMELGAESRTEKEKGEEGVSLARERALHRAELGVARGPQRLSSAAAEPQ